MCLEGWEDALTEARRGTAHTVPRREADPAGRPFAPPADTESADHDRSGIEKRVAADRA